MDDYLVPFGESRQKHEQAGYQGRHQGHDLAPEYKKVVRVGFLMIHGLSPCQQLGFVLRTFFWSSAVSLSPVDGDFALFDHIYLGRAPRDFDLTAQ